MSVEIIERNPVRSKRARSGPLRSPLSRKPLGGTGRIPVREDLRNAFQIALLGGLLIWSPGCSSAPTTPKAEPSSRPVMPVGGSECKDIGAPILIHRVEPDYPAYVRKQRIEGVVIAEAHIARDGNVENIRVVSSPSENLTSLAIKAFSQWRYKPAFCKDSGTPVRVYLTVTATFSLHERPKRY